MNSQYAARKSTCADVLRPLSATVPILLGGLKDSDDNRGADRQLTNHIRVICVLHKSSPRNPPPQAHPSRWSLALRRGVSTEGVTRTGPIRESSPNSPTDRLGGCRKWETLRTPCRSTSQLMAPN